MDVTLLLKKAGSGDSTARGELIQATYEELRKLASARMKAERPDHTLTATALVHEVSLQLLNQSQIAVENHGQFLALAATAMRNLLIDHARSRGREKRGGGRKKLELDNALVACDQQSPELLNLHEALNRFAEIDERKSKVVEMRYFGGLSIHEVATALDVSPATVKRDWEVAKAWLLRELKQGDAGVD